MVGEVLELTAPLADDRQVRLEPPHAVGMSGRPFQGMHAAHRTADHRQQAPGGPRGANQVEGLAGVVVAKRARCTHQA